MNELNRDTPNNRKLPTVLAPGNKIYLLRAGRLDFLRDGGNEFIPFARLRRGGRVRSHAKGKINSHLSCRYLQATGSWTHLASDIRREKGFR